MENEYPSTNHTGQRDSLGNGPGKDIFSILSLTLPTKASQKYSLGQLKGLGLPFTLAAIVARQSKLVIAIVPDSLEAAKLERALSFFLNKEPIESRNLKDPTVSNEAIPILSFPDWETLPYDSFSPHQDIISERLTTLYRLPHITKGVLIVPVSTLMHRLSPQAFLIQNSLLVKKQDIIDLDEMKHRLSNSGYYHTSQVVTHGEFAIRGSILDLFPMGSTKPYRIDLFDQAVDSIRVFNVENQRTEEKVDEVHLLPAREFPLDADAISRFRNHFREEFEGDPRQCSIYIDVSEGHASPGLEYYLPLFFENTASLFDYLPADSLLVLVGDVEKSSEAFWEQTKTRYEQYRHDRMRPILEPKKLFLQTNEVFNAIKQFPSINLSHETLPESAGNLNLNFETLPDISQTFNQPLTSSHGTPLQHFLEQFKGNVLFTAETLGRREVLKELLASLQKPTILMHHFDDLIVEFSDELIQKNRLQDHYGLAVASLDDAMIWNPPAPYQPLCIIPEAVLFGKKVMQRRLRKSKVSPDFDFEVQSLAELTIGAPVVHLEYGIGRYLGLSHLTLAGQEAEFLTLEYAGNDKLYIPVTSLHLVSRYSGVDIEHAPLSRLGTGQWEKIKRKVLEETHDVAAELLEIYAKREAKREIIQASR